MPIAFFDLDRTVLSVNSATLWVRRELREGRIRWRDGARAAAWMGLYHLGAAHIEGALLRAAAFMRGQDEDELRARTRRFWTEEVRPFVRPGALACIARHRTAGDPLHLLTSSSSYLSEVVVEDLGFDGFLANHFESHEGVLTGAARLPLCFGAGKVERAAALLRTLGTSFDDTVFYTDSFSDLPMLEAVATPVVVHPDPRLRRAARARAWVIEDWGEAEHPSR